MRRRLDTAGLTEARIAASNELDEYRIQALVAGGAPIDIWGVGTRLVTARDDPALTGVYKLIAREVNGRLQPVIKVSDDPEKISNPGLKQVHRFIDENGSPMGDLLALEGENVEARGEHRFYDAADPSRFRVVRAFRAVEPLLSPKMSGGRMLEPPADLRTIQKRARDLLTCLPEKHKRLRAPSPYEVALSEGTRDLKRRLTRRRSKG